MSSKRTFWTKLNHDDARMSIEMMDDAEIGRWFRGWLAGAGGKEYTQEKLATFPLEMRTGFSAGRESFEDAERYSEKQRERVSKRYRGDTMVYRGSTTVEFGSEKPSESLPANSEQPTANNQQRTTSNDPPLNSPKGKRFVPPTEEEWVDYCRETWTDWHPECSAEAWAYYESKGWRIGNAPCKEWKAAARTAHGNARSWGKLQPVSVQGRSSNSAQKMPVDAKAPEWQLRQWIREDKDLLSRADEEVKQAHHARCQHRVQSPEFAAGTVVWEEAKEKAEKIRRRIRDRENKLGET